MFQRKPSPEFVQLALFPELIEPALPLHAEASEESSGRLVRRPQRPEEAPAAETEAVPLPPPLPAAGPAPSQRAGEKLLEVLVHHLGAGLASLVLTSNHTRIISARPERDGSLHLRVHRSFAEAPPEIVAALVAFLKAPRRPKRAEALQQIREYFDTWRSRETAPPAKKRRTRLAARGEFFDLAAMRDQVNLDYFDGKLEVAITWGKSSTPLRGRKRGFSIRLGSYHERENLVRIHPVLDRADVPFYVVESIVHHEMVHAVVPTQRGKSRRIVHSAEFRRLERLYRQHTEAEAWLKANIERLAKLR